MIKRTAATAMHGCLMFLIGDWTAAKPALYAAEARFRDPVRQLENAFEVAALIESRTVDPLPAGGSEQEGSFRPRAALTGKMLSNPTPRAHVRDCMEAAKPAVCPYSPRVIRLAVVPSALHRKSTKAVTRRALWWRLGYTA